jgi:hypothetical protein
MVLWGGAIIALISRIISGIPISQLERDRSLLVTEHARTGKNTPHSESLAIPTTIVLVGELLLFLIRFKSNYADITTPLATVTYLRDVTVSSIRIEYIGIKTTFAMLYFVVITFDTCANVYLHNVVNNITWYREKSIGILRLRHQVSIGRWVYWPLLLISFLKMRWYSPAILFFLGAGIAFLFVGPFVGIIENALNTGPSSLRRVITKLAWIVLLPTAIVDYLIGIDQANSTNVVMGIVSGIAIMYITWFVFRRQSTRDHD